MLQASVEVHFLLCSSFKLSDSEYNICDRHNDSMSVQIRQHESMMYTNDKLGHRVSNLSITDLVSIGNTLRGCLMLEDFIGEVISSGRSRRL